MEIYIIYALIALLTVIVVVSADVAGAKASSLEDFSIPTAEEGRAISIVLGTRMITSPNVVWYGDLDTSRVKSGSFFSKKTTGYKYYLGMHMVICHSGIDSINKIVVDDTVIWSGENTGTRFFIDKGSIFGGKRKEGGIKGWVDVELGGANQGVNSYLEGEIRKELLDDMPTYPVFVPSMTFDEYLILHNIMSTDTPGAWFNYSKQTNSEENAHDVAKAEYDANQLASILHQIPAYRGVVSVILNSMYIGTTSHAKPWSFLVKATDKDSLGNPLWYAEKAKINSSDMNPAHIIYQCLTSKHWGLGLPDGELDQDNFRLVADYFHTEKFGLSFIINREGSIEDFVSEVLRHINAALRIDVVTNKFQIKLMRKDYNVSELEVFDKHKIKKVSKYKITSISEVINTVTVTYWDRDLGEKSTVKLQNLAAISLLGGV